MLPSRELLFGPLAQELGARALARPPAPAAGVAQVEPAPFGARVAVAFTAAALPGADRALLLRLPSARFASLPPGGSGLPEEEWLSCAREELRCAAADNSAAACLFAAVEEAARPPAAPRFMGIVNVTPDSFSDGGRYLDPARAIERGLELEAEGAHILDVGGESTRPGAEPVDVEEELRRVLPVIEGLAARARAQISVDTSKAAVARAALDRGASMVNDVTAGRGDPGMLPLAAERGAEIVLMHMQGTPRDMQREPIYGDPVAEVARFLRARVAACLQAGVALQRMVLDPGIGFGKRLEHNLELLRRLSELRSLGRPLCLGVSRKSFIAHATGRLRQDSWPRSPAGRGGASDRSGGSASALAFCVAGGAEILRVHDVALCVEAAGVALAISRRPLLPPEGELQRSLA